MEEPLRAGMWQRTANLASGLAARHAWRFHGLSLRMLAKHTWKAVLADRLFGHAAELGFYFLFALFPTLFCAGTILGLAARSAHQISDKLLDYLALVIPTTALGTVLSIFNETTAGASSGKVTFGSIAAIWSASVGISAIQDTLNEVYKLKDTRSYFAARIYAIALTILLTFLVTLGLGCMFSGDFFAALAGRFVPYPMIAAVTAFGIRVVAWAIASCLLAVSFEVLYCWAPDRRERRWRWFTPGTTVGVVGWLVASLGFRVYIHFFNTYTITYGSLGAVIILLMWFYLCGLMLLLGAEIDFVIDDAVGIPSPYAPR
ncbi:MAG TPA: YihY/virulence factor BrkB family protein [Terracidiphilus sp.]|jgi:membrane protein|nr:YihY/virulence factor BrkB family protein [Terracidiphilus sp.]